MAAGVTSSAWCRFIAPCLDWGTARYGMVRPLRLSRGRRVITVQGEQVSQEGSAGGAEQVALRPQGAGELGVEVRPERHSEGCTGERGDIPGGWKA